MASIEPAAQVMSAQAQITLELLTIPGDHRRDEELRAIGVFACICHAEQAFLGMFQLEVLILKLGSVDGLSSSAISICEVSTLNHE